MKKMLLGLLMVSGIAFGMDEPEDVTNLTAWRTGAGDTADQAPVQIDNLVNAMRRYNDASAAARIADEDTLPIKFGAMAVTCCLMSIVRDDAAPRALVQACAGSCCCGIMAEGYNQVYAFGQRRARTDLLRVIRAEKFDATILNRQDIQTWATRDPEINRAIIDRKAMDGATAAQMK